MNTDVFSSDLIESSEVIQLAKRMYKAIIVAICMLVLIIDTKTAVSGAAEGVDLCIHVLIPSLFPFFLISILLTDLLTGTTSAVMRPIGKLLRIPHGSESMYLIGLLGGYPVGAQVIHQATQRGTLDKRDAERMLGFCNNPGPAFLFGVISTQFADPIYIWLIWAILILSTIFTAILIPGECKKVNASATVKHISTAEALEKSLKAMAGVCGWVIVFRIIIVFLQRWFLWMIPDALSIAIQTFLELANGSMALNQIDNIGLRFLICTLGLTCGGFCVLMQTASVSGASGIGKYVPGKLIQTGISMLMSVPIILCINHKFPTIYMVAALIIYIPFIATLSYCRKKHQNKYSILLSGSV